MAEMYEEFYEKSYKIRKRFLEIFGELGYGHLTTAFSEAEILIALLSGVMNFNEKNVRDKNRDRIVISKGHGAGMLFPVFEDMGILSEEEIKDMIRPGGDFTKIKDLFYPGFEFYGGSLGIGLGMAAGLALGAKLNREDWFTFCILGDAECYEGAIWEAMLFAGHNKLNNLVVVVDRNYLGCSDFTENMCELEPFEDKWKSCKWDTRVVNGHVYEELFEAFAEIRVRKTSRPLCVIADTVKGKGLNDLCNKPLRHGYMPTGDKLYEAYEKLEKIHFKG